MTGSTSPEDLYDDRRAPGSRWTRVNVGEAIRGVPTPLSWSIWRPAMDHGFWWSQERLGIVGRHDARPPVTGIALGHPVVSVDVTVAQVARMPGYDPEAFAQQYFGSLAAHGPAAAASRLDPRLLGRVAWRAPSTLATLGRRVAANSAAADEWWRSTIEHGSVDDPRALLAECRRRFIDAMAIHTLAGMLCQGIYERASALAGDLASTIVSTDGDLAEARVAADLWAVAHGRLDMEEFLRRHGFHGPDEGELASHSWREDPAPVSSAAAGWANADETRSPEASVRRRADDRRVAQERLLGALPRWRRGPARTVLALARTMIAQREVGKAAFLRHLDAARWCARQLGEDAVWCTFEELQQGIRPSDAELVARAARRTELASVELPLNWVGDPEPIVRQRRVDLTGSRLEGIGASPGVTRGRARVVLDPSLLGEPIGPGEVLVARTTDPSWVTLFLTAGALVIDVGGALSHGAIIARELAIPCVIGTGDGTNRIADGTELIVDGGAGTVTFA